MAEPWISAGMPKMGPVGQSWLAIRLDLASQMFVVKKKEQCKLLFMLLIFFVRKNT